MHFKHVLTYRQLCLDEYSIKLMTFYCEIVKGGLCILLLLSRTQQFSIEKSRAHRGILTYISIHLTLDLIKQLDLLTLVDNGYLYYI